MTSAATALADEVHERVMARHPFAATTLGLPGHDGEVTDLSAAAEQEYGRDLAALADRVRDVRVDGPADRVTQAATAQLIGSEQDEIAVRAVEHTVGLLGASGPTALLALCARTRLATPEQAQAHLERTAGFARYLDQHVERLRTGQSDGRLPVATLVAVALAQADGYLSGTGDVLADVAPPEGWDGAGAWSARLGDLVRDEVRPAVARWRDAVAGLDVRPDERCGLVHLPGGAADYERLVGVHTTLDLTAQQVHELGRAAVAELVERMSALGASLGLTSYEQVRDAVRSSGAAVPPEEAMAAAREAVRRAEAAVVGVFPEPLPPPCEVTAMSEHLARAGMPPHYTGPVAERGTLGTYWFNAVEPGAGSGWDLEATAYHEAVPGHHLQIARQQGLAGVSRVQRYGFVTAHVEGWGLYAEVLAGELGLYSSTEAALGSLGVQLFRAARLVVDTGIHALGWSREEAVRWFAETVPLPEPFIVSEVNRYIGLPGQALAYLVGQREILRLRASAQATLGDRFDLAGFHGAVLDSGTVPLPALGVAVDGWVASVAQGLRR